MPLTHRPTASSNHAACFSDSKKTYLAPFGIPAPLVILAIFVIPAHFVIHAKFVIPAFFVISAFFVIPAIFVIPAFYVIPAKAGIQNVLLRPLRLVLVLIVVLFAPAAAKEKEAASKSTSVVSYEPTSNYSVVDIQGWRVHVHNQLQEDGKQAKLGQEALNVMHFQLYLINKWVPETPLAELKKVPIWIGDDPKGKNHYHPNRQWLVENNYNPEKAKSVDIERVESFIRVAHTNVNVLMHELAHAYHDRVLSFDDQRIREMYKNAKESGKYESVLKLNGKPQKHYALTDHKEYFAESTEAFFGTNDFYPFLRPELKAHDPNIHNLLSEIWLGK